MKIFNLLFIFGFILNNYINCLIIPEEVPTILSLIYSNIPPIKKGTDSRVGVGFRLGEHADFQVMLELGPQKETEKFGNTDTMKGELGTLAKNIAKYNIYKMKQTQVKSQDKHHQINDEKDTSNNWLIKWSKEMSSKNDDQISETPEIQKIRMASKPE
ncbi:hypothetical protein HCN44_003785 [Aphidius gifuensis]|uniref:Odorant-binding protein n=1 Tax=Aphidius gifuensis TaxID=684658 RepID=A0A834XLT0_APHGI|nr:hypothetical protein HCN44_003785 [Aphidius gifuensis]